MNPRDEKLQRLHDGELEEAEAGALTQELSDAERGKLQALREIDGLIKTTLLAEADEAKLDLWTGLEGKLAPRPATRRRSYAMFATALTFAAAAAAAVLLRPAPAPSNHCVIESLEVAGAVATVVEIEGEKGDSTTVIWMDHEESDEWESL